MGGTSVGRERGCEKRRVFVAGEVVEACCTSEL